MEMKVKREENLELNAVEIYSHAHHNHSEVQLKSHSLAMIADSLQPSHESFESANRRRDSTVPQSRGDFPLLLLLIAGFSAFGFTLISKRHINGTSSLF